MGHKTTTDEINHNNNTNKKHFVFVHGFGHGAWCWYKLLPLIKINGHDATAVNLAGCGSHPSQIHQISSIADYVQPLMDLLAALPSDRQVILVGHSYGGIPISLAMETFPGKVSGAVFVSAYMPNCIDPPGTLIQEFLSRCTMESLMDCEVTFDKDRAAPGKGPLPISALFGPDYMAARVYTGCPAEDLELGRMMIRPNLFFMEEMGKEHLLSETRYGKIKRSYVLCKSDRVMEEEFQRYIIDKSPPDNVVSIEGAGHMAMLSKPEQLCSCLLELFADDK